MTLLGFELDNSACFEKQYIPLRKGLNVLVGRRHSTRLTRPARAAYAAYPHERAPSERSAGLGLLTFLLAAVVLDEVTGGGAVLAVFRNDADVAAMLAFGWQLDLDDFSAPVAHQGGRLWTLDQDAGLDYPDAVKRPHGGPG